MANLQSHLRNTFLAGIFAIVPVAITIFVIYWIDKNTRALSGYLIGHEVPFLGIVIAIAAIYFAGLIATSLIGRFFFRLIDRLLGRVPILRDAYRAWKQIALTPGGGADGTFSKVV